MSAPEFASTSSLPDGWVLVRLADLVERLESGKRPKGGVRGINEGVPSIGGEHLTRDGGFDFSALRYVPEEFFDSLSKGRIAIGDILVVKDGATTGKVALVRSGFPFERAAVNEHVFLLRPARGVSPHYLFWYLWSEAGQRAIRDQVRGAAQGGIVRAFADAVRVPLPPRAEQDRIVEAVESAMAVTRRGMEELSEATQLTAALRDGVLEHALPSGTSEVELQECLLEPPRNGRSVPTASSGFPVLRLTAIRDGRVDTREAKTGAWSEEEARPFLIREGDFLVVRGNGSLRLVGRGGLVGTAPERVAYPDTLIRLRPNPEKLSGEYLRAVWNSRRIRRQLESQARTTAGIYKINQQMLKTLRIPLPPLDVQHVVARAVKNRLADFDSLTRELEKQSRAARHLEFQLLHQAFTGQLVPQDPADEPALELLKRIEAEKAEREAELKAANQSGKVGTSSG